MEKRCINNNSSGTVEEYFYSNGLQFLIAIKDCSNITDCNTDCYSRCGSANAILIVECRAIAAAIAFAGSDCNPIKYNWSQAWLWSSLNMDCDKRYPAFLLRLIAAWVISMCATYTVELDRFLLPTVFYCRDKGLLKSNVYIPFELGKSASPASTISSRGCVAVRVVAFERGDSPIFQTEDKAHLPPTARLALERATARRAPAAALLLAP